MGSCVLWLCEMEEGCGGRNEMGGIREGVGLVFEFAAVFGAGDDVEVDGAVFEDFDHGCC